MEDTLVRLASLLATGFIRSTEGFFSTLFCHEQSERAINSNGNHAKPSPPLPAPGQIDLSHPGTSPAQGLQMPAGRWCCSKGCSKGERFIAEEFAQ